LSGLVQLVTVTLSTLLSILIKALVELSIGIDKELIEFDVDLTRRALVAFANKASSRRADTVTGRRLT